MAEVLLVGVDGGGTGSRARLADLSGRVLGEGEAGPANLRFGVAAGLGAAREAVEAALAAAGLPSESLSRAVAAFGLAGATEPTMLAAARAEPHPFAALAITADAQIACLGAHAGQDGGIVIVGTGTCGWAQVHGEQHRIGGWGFPISDEGSGAWIGAEAIRRTLWARDGLVPWTPLLAEIFERFERTPTRIVAWMTGAKPRDFATLAPLVVSQAEAGDAAAEALMRAAAGHVAALARRLLELGAPRLSLVGGLAPHVERWLPSEIAARVEPAQGDALDGALRIAHGEAEARGLVGREPRPVGERA